MAKPTQLKPPAAAPAKAPALPAPSSRLWRSLVLFVILLVATILFWKIVLLKPLNAMLRGVSELSFSLLPGGGSTEIITVDANGDWLIHASVLFRPRPVAQHNLQPNADPQIVRTPYQWFPALTLALPIFWAIALAVRPGKGVWRILGIGTLSLTLLSLFSAVLYLANWTNQFYEVLSWPPASFLLETTGYTLMSVAPYAAPLVVIMWLDRTLRSRVFGESTARIPPAPGS
jgi:hypothetical protein